MQKYSLYYIIMSMSIKQNVIKYIVEKKESKTKHRDIIEWIRKELWETISNWDIVKIWNESKKLIEKQSSALKDINDVIGDEKKYDVIDNHYVVYAKNHAKWITEQFKIPVEEVDKIFNDYSRNWANLTGQAIMNKYNLKPKAWNLIKSHIWLYKDSHILSPLSMDNAASEWKIDEVIQEVSYRNFEDKYRNKYREAHVDILEREVKNLSKILWTLDWFLDYMKPKLQIAPLQFKKRKIEKLDNRPVFAFWDKHIWKRDTDWVVSRLNDLALDIISDPSSEVVLVDLGDHFEALMQWGMHSWQVEWMDGKYMWELFMYWVQIYISFLKNILDSWKSIHLKGIGWNHDRISTKNEWDNERVFSTIFYEMLKMYLAKANIEIDYYTKRLWLFTVDNIDYAVNHWEEFGRIKADALRSKVITNTNNHLVALFAHYHSASIEQWRWVTKVWIPGLAWLNDFDERLLLLSDPWYVKIQQNRHGKPNVEYRYFNEKN